MLYYEQDSTRFVDAPIACSESIGSVLCLCTYQSGTHVSPDDGEVIKLKLCLIFADGQSIS